MRDLPFAMFAANALVDYKFNKPNRDDKKRKSKDKGKDKQTKDGKKNKDKQKKNWGNKSKEESSTSQQSKEQPELNAGCFICNGPHRAKDCPKCEKLNVS